MMPPGEGFPTASACLRWSIGFFLVVACVVLRPLAFFWNENPDYFFGWGVPFLAVYLLVERWAARPPRESRGTASTWTLGQLSAAVGVWGGIFLLMRLVVETEPQWRPGLLLTTGLLVVALWIWTWLFGGWSWLRHFVFPIGFLFLGVPWLFNLEFPLVQGLMRWNATLVASSLVLGDLPAQAAGNTIVLAAGQLGVNEACSGIRSLQAGWMMSLFLGEFYRCSLKVRLVLPIIAIVLALGGNYGRLLFLAWRGAHHGLAAVEESHDEAGSLILIFTVIGLWLACLAFRKTEPPIVASPLDTLGPPVSLGRQNRLAVGFAAGLVLMSLMAEGFTQGWYAWRENSASRHPSWTVQWPMEERHFQTVPLTDATQKLLRYDEAKAARWVDETGWRWSGYWFRYRPRSSSKIVFESHNPQICLSGEGWQLNDDEGEFTRREGSIDLPTQGYRFLSATGSHFVFWVAYRNRGEGAVLRTGLYGHSWEALLSRSTSWLDDAWAGRRGTDAETLEMAVTGPENYTQAQQAYLDFLRQAVHPTGGE